MMIALLMMVLAGIAAMTFGNFVVRDRGQKLLQLLAVAISILLLCGAIRSGFEQRLEGSVWMPRYLGVIWPALAISVAALIWRIPLMALRWAAIVILLAPNLAQGAARFLAHSEPPIDRVAADAWASLQPDATVRAYTLVAGRSMGSPATGTIYNQVGRYYLYVLRGTTEPPEHERGVLLMDVFQHWPSSPFSNGIDDVMSDLRSNPQLQRIVVWDRPDEGPSDQELDDALGSDWKRDSEEVFPVRVSWNWGHLCDYRRREYSRAGASSPPRASDARSRKYR
jgi:hypothetical protein